jgi:CCR4-NOT transcription complex subunit 1
MSFPPLHPSRDSSASSDSKPALSGSARPRQSAWGLSASNSVSRRDLTPLDTSVPSSTESGVRRSDASNPSTNSLTSPFATPFPSLGNSFGRVSSRNTPSISTSTSPFAPYQSGSQQLSSSQLLSPRSRATTPFPNTTSASSAAASTTASQGGGGGSSSGGGPSRAGTFVPSVGSHTVTSPTASSFDRNSFNTAINTSTNPSQSSLSKITITQVFLLLGSITEKEGKAKWESQADAIRKV